MSKIADSKNPLGIPNAPFIENVDKFLEIEKSTTEEMIAKLDEMLGKYRMLESSLQRKLHVYKQKVPSIEESLNAIKQLEHKDDNGEIHTKYQLADTIYSKAKIKDADNVYLWLGANCMVEYPCNDAIELLEKNKIAADKQLKQTQENLDFLRDQINTTEVNIARIYNNDVHKRRKARQTSEKK